ncbi:unnamed protein product [Musa acuminata var. zebrina]
MGIKRIRPAHGPPRDRPALYKPLGSRNQRFRSLASSRIKENAVVVGGFVLRLDRRIRASGFRYHSLRILVFCYFAIWSYFSILRFFLVLLEISRVRS